MVQPGDKELDTISEFHPKFTYPIFGEAEQIFGYKGLEINLSFAAHDGSPHAHISYDQKFPPVKSTSALDLNQTLQEFLPASAFDRDYAQCIQQDTHAKDWHPPGSLVHSYAKGNRDFEVWAGSLLDPKVNALVNNIQILVLFFIEAGSLLNLNEVDWSLDRWRVYFVYEKVATSNPQAAPYSLVGYATTYRFYCFKPRSQKSSSSALDNFPHVDPLSPAQLTSRLRISQFIILPPYQSSGHGSQLYQSIYKEVIADPTIVELSVEDPSEEFDRLRDACDWKVLEPQFKTANIQIDTAGPLETTKRIQRTPTAQILSLHVLRDIRLRNKIAFRQFSRQVELYLLSLIPFSHRSSGGANLTKIKIQKHTNKDPSDRLYYWWRILVKQRIYKKNKDVLRDMDPEDRIAKLEDSARGQEDEYEGLLMLFALRQANKEGLNENGSSDEVVRLSSRKRKVVVDDEDEEDEEEEELVMPKRPKV